MSQYKSIYVNKKLGGRKTIFWNGDYYDWNTAYKTYNSRKKNELLRWEDILGSPPKR